MFQNPVGNPNVPVTVVVSGQNMHLREGFEQVDEHLYVVILGRSLF